MKIHLFHLSPHGLVRAFSHLRAGRRLCKIYNNKLLNLIPSSINSMTAAWNYSETLREYRLDPPATIIDVGAHSSQMSKMLAMASSDKLTIVSFEPNPSLKPLGQRFELALSDSDGIASFSTPGNDTGWGTIKRVSVSEAVTQVKKMRFDSVVKTKMISFDDLPKPILVKIDTEGSEYDVLVGFGDYLSKVDYLIIEVENSFSRGDNYSLVSLCKRLSDYGFSKSKILYSCYDGPVAPAYSDIMYWR